MAARSPRCRVAWQERSETDPQLVGLGWQNSRASVLPPSLSHRGSQCAAIAWEGEAQGWARESEKGMPYLTLFSFVTHARSLVWNKTVDKKNTRGSQEGRKDGAYVFLVSRSLRWEGSIENKKPPEKSLGKYILAKKIQIKFWIVYSKPAKWRLVL